MSHSLSRVRLLALGARDTLPLVLAAVPFAIIYGAIAQSTGLSAWATVSMSALVFAGSAQFIAIGLLASATAVPVILFTVFIVNLRHLLYAASLIPQVQQLPQRWKIPLAFSLTDETYATVANRLNQHGDRTYLHWYYLGSGLLMYTNWVAFSFAGLTLGQRIPALMDWGLDVAMIVAFIGIVVPALRTRPQWCCAGVAGAGAMLTYHWPYQTGLLASSLLAITTGVLLEGKKYNREKDHD